MCSALPLRGAQAHVFAKLFSLEKSCQLIYQAHDGLEAACERAEAASAERDELELERAGALDHIALLQVHQG